jgi:acyl-[acyl-carrier-protein]-phospholipid O-acyltransferase / long-chain-fatty-acid--[acyl-carrier-protein] ligase
LTSSPSKAAKTPLLAALVIGVGVGSVLAGIWSYGRIELGILPLGALGVAFSSMALFLVRGEIFHPDTDAALNGSLAWACAWLFLLGTSAGLFSVPLESYLQHRSPQKERGAILAAANFLVFSGVLLFSVLFYGLRLPVFEGTFEAIPAALREPASAEDAARVDRREQQFVEAWKSAPPAPSLPAHLTDVPAALRSVTLTRLLWQDIQQRRERDLSAEDHAYIEQLPDEAATIRAVLKYAGKQPLFSARQIFLIAGLGTVPVFLYIVCLIPQASVRFIVWLASHTVYRIRVMGRDNLPEVGGAVLAANHVSWADGVLLLVTSSRPVRFIVYAGNFANPLLNWLARLAGAILISSNPKSIVRGLAAARDAIQQGELVCIFPEGSISRSGQLQAFKPGIMKLLEGQTDSPVIPVYLDELWGSIFSFERGKFFWKMPRQLPYPVSIHFGTPLKQPKDVYEIRRAVEELGARAVEQRSHRFPPPQRSFLRSCKQRLWRQKIVDSTGARLTGGSLLLRTLMVRRLLRRHVLSADEQFVGVLLPPAAGAVVVNAALALDRRVACNLNYSVSSEIINACIRQAGIRHVLTSRKFMEKMEFKIEAEVVYLEDLRDKPRLTDKLITALQSYVLPAFLLERLLGLNTIQGDDLLTVIFTSGSTGTPKGVMLTHSNIASNTQAVDQVVHLRSDDVVIGILPFFHSFGYTVPLWTVLCTHVSGVYHFSPLDAKQIGKLCRDHGATILLATPTFLRSYMKRCEPEDFKTLNVVVVGAEKLPKDLSDAFEEKYSVRPVEGYGATELSPLVSVNVPPSRSLGNYQVDCREGSVGRPIPGVSAKIVHPETGGQLGVNEDGMLLIRGPNVMKGYLGQEEHTAAVIRDGWYVTGDIAHLDNDGFIHITGRESRFSKIGGEMVPHVKIEEELNRVIDSIAGSGEEATLKAVVTAVPDEKKGERLIVLYLKNNATVDQMRKGLADSGMPNLFIPGTESFLVVEELPLLGSGKLDLKAVKQMAVERIQQKS